MADKRIKDLTNTAAESDLVSGYYLAIDGSAGTKKLPGNTIAPKSVQDKLCTESSFIDGVNHRTVKFFNVQEYATYEIELSVTSWACSGPTALQIYYYNGSSYVTLHQVNGSESVTVDKKYRIRLISSNNAKYIGVFVTSDSAIDQHVSITRINSGAIEFLSPIDGQNNNAVNSSIFGLRKGRLYKLAIDSSDATFENVTASRFNLSYRNNGSSVDVFNSSSIVGKYIFRAVENELYSVLFRCDSGTRIRWTIEDVTDELVSIYEADSCVWDTAHYVSTNDGKLSTSSLNATMTAKLEGVDYVEVVMGYAVTSSDTGLVFYDKDFNFISGKRIDSGSPSRSYRKYFVQVPAGTVFCKASMYKELLGKFELVGLPSLPANYAATHKKNHAAFFGSIETYTSDTTADSFTSLNAVHTSELYAEYDAIVSEYPEYFSRQSDLATVTRIEDEEEFVIRSYRMSFNGKVAFDHEPTSSETVTLSNNVWLEGNSPRKLLIVGGMHGEEKTPCWGLMLALRELMTSDHPNAKFIRDNFTLEIIPCLNPAGWDMCRRGNCNNKVLNREEAANEPETLAYMSWIETNKDAFLLFDFHGTQGRFAYTPVMLNLPISNVVMKMTERVASALYRNNAEFYASQSASYASSYKPYLIAKYSGDSMWDRARLACRMFQDYGMQEFALETPDNLTTGAIDNNDKRNCKITKQLFFNFVPLIGSMQKNFDF